MKQFRSKRTVKWVELVLLHWIRLDERPKVWKVIGWELHEDKSKCLIRVVLFPDYSSCVQ